MKNSYPYKVLNHNEIEKPIIHEGNLKNIEHFLYEPLIHFTDTLILIKTKLYIYSKEHNQTLKLVEVTPFAKLKGFNYPENIENENHAEFISELYLVHQTHMNHVLISRTQIQPEHYEKFNWNPINLFNIEKLLSSFEYLYGE